MKAVIIDDEFIVIEGLMKMIDWPSFGIDIAATANNGLEALDLIRRHRPELILTDIRMPGMDGLQLLETVKSILPDAYTIVFSGYNEFEYVKKAIQIGASDYLEKPITVQSVGRALRKAADRLRRDREIREKVKDGLRADLQAMTIELLKGRFRDYDRWTEAACDLVECLTAVTVLVSPDRLRLEDRHECAFITIPQEDGFITVIAHREPPDPQLWEYIEGSGDAPVGAGSTHDHVSRLADSLKEAKKALRCAQYLNHNGLLRYEELGEWLTAPGDLSEREEDIMLSLRAGHYAGLMENVDRFVAWLREQPLDPEIVERELVKILYLALSASKEIVRLGEDSGPLPHLELRDLKGKDEMLDWFRGQMDRIVGSMLEIRENSKHDTIERAKRYIDEHLADDLSLQTLAAHLNMSPSGLSLMFKEVTGTTYIKYMTRLRMERAKQLLAEGRKVGEVSEMVGYYTYRHFTDVFKQQTGMTPGQYREKFAAGASGRRPETDGGTSAD